MIVLYNAVIVKGRYIMIGGGIGMPELLVVLVIVLIIFGAGKLPEIGKGLGKGIRNFRKATSGMDEIDVTPKEDEKELHDKGQKSD
jgi:sec-independent protein translocase protein TatA